ncbi:MAG TPA: trypsin-like peptidase domain-containing protein [Verrucomicrobiae bacterium]|nr:trypsin-like peptidase domain-containing protein [Verrucomicrobiae bacterium]
MNQHPTPQQPTQNEAPIIPTPSPKKLQKTGKKGVPKGVKVLGIVLLCFVASFFGSWAFISSGLIKLSDHTTVETRRQLVLQEGEVVAETAKEVSPSVVSIVTQTARSRSFFNTNEGGGSGTGIVISKDGYIITNKHVIPETTAAVKVILADGTSYENVTVVGRDPLNDIAFLKINGVNNLKPARISDEKVITGQKVVAIGNALGQYQNTVTAGIISGMGRPVTAEDNAGGTEQLLDLYQTDAAINPGNSGGPLVNLAGEVIGINTAVVDDAQGIGFAIPIKAAKGLIKGVLADGKVERGYLGTRFITLTPEIAQNYSLNITRGAYIKTQSASVPSVVAGGPADKAGLKEGDIVTKVNDEKIDESAGLSLLIAQYAPGDTVQLTVQRGGGEVTLNVTLGAYSAANR